MAIHLENISKTYTQYAHGIDRLFEIITHRTRHKAFTALHPINLAIPAGQVVGIVGNNGAGKSTFLKIVAGTLQPDTGIRHVEGRVTALLELGAGFHPEMTGRENVYLMGAMMGLAATEVDKIYAEIVEFAGIEPFMEQPVKTYSTGMFLRLAFSVATAVEPDILVVDEALSVGDGAFARRSFNRFMQFKQQGKTILFCSHALYQVEAICDRVLWIDRGHIRLDGAPSTVISAYNDAMVSDHAGGSDPTEPQALATTPAIHQGTAHLRELRVSVDGHVSDRLDVSSQQSELCVTIAFVSDPTLPTPTVGLVINGADERVITSAGTRHDGLQIERDAQGAATVRVTFPNLALLKGEYWVDAYLLCENAIHIYDQANGIAILKVRQEGLELGVVSLPRAWSQI